MTPCPGAAHHTALRNGPPAPAPPLLPRPAVALPQPLPRTAAPQPPRDTSQVRPAR